MNDRITVTDSEFDNLRTAAEKNAAATTRMLEIGQGVGGLGIQHPEMFEDMLNWDRMTENAHADTVLALLARLDEVTAERDALAAVVAEAQAEGELTGYHRHKEPIMAILDATPSSVLAAHDAKVRAEALRGAADVFWNRRPNGQAYNGYAVAEELRDLADKEENR